MHRATFPTNKGYNMDWVKCEDVVQGIRVKSLWHSSGQKARSTLTKEVSHEEERSLVQSLEQPDVSYWEPTQFLDIKDCSMIHGVEGVFNI